jgi:hypothetical protein
MTAKSLKNPNPDVETMSPGLGMARGHVGALASLYNTVKLLDSLPAMVIRLLRAQARV